MGYWKSKVLPKIKKVFEKNGNKKAAADACKSFDDSKESISKELEDKKTELQPKVVEVYEASSTEIKTVVKERSAAVVKKNSSAVQKFLEELVKIDFPGSKQACEAATKFGPTLASGPVLFVFEKVSTFVVVEEKKETETATTETTTEETSSKEKEVLIEEEKEKEKVAQVEEVAKEAEPSKTEPTPTEPAKVGEEPPKP